MGDPWGIGGFMERGGGEGLEGANHKKKKLEENLKNREKIEK